MPQLRKSLRVCATLALFLGLLPSLGRAGTWLPFGPVSYTRGTGTPVTVTNTFTLLNPNTQLEFFGIFDFFGKISARRLRRDSVSARCTYRKVLDQL